ncbi:hypothetical protein ASE70_01720 [Sphingomonas sp. Leaf22]|uniref:hypothetical protein n=1 Tax=Sphingomonas sp. Leaf22 TaxID=1735687 RepID=UPI0006F40BA0|nr:hypothetical protein [Sphingomonas sp. Leaf22]KQM95453.1 hypothetical protein ASE70_01720 [Sphingomonas sp. Leaf22]
MRLDIGAAVRDAVAIWRRDRDVIVAVAGVFFFLPNLALSLLLTTAQTQVSVGAAGAADERAMLAVMQAQLIDNAPWFGLQLLVELIGIAVLLTLLLDSTRPTVGEALRSVARRLPVLVAATLLVNAAKTVGLLLLVLPGLYVIGRVFVVMPVLVAEPERRFGDAMSRALALTRGHVLQLLSLSALLYFGGQLIALLLTNTASAVSRSGGNPVTMAMLATAIAFVGAAMSTAFALVRATVYRRLASRG